MSKKGLFFAAKLNGDTDWSVDQNAIECPFCGETYMHHKDVRIYYRKVDSGDTFIRQIRDHEVGFMVTSEGRINPSSRRDAIGIRFECECCHGKYDDEPAHEIKPPIELCIVQHKGITHVYWRLWENIKTDTPQNVVHLKKTSS